MILLYVLLTYDKWAGLCASSGLEGLSRMTMSAESRVQLYGVRVVPSTPSVSHIFFAITCSYGD